MKIYSVVILCCLSVSVVSCSDKQMSSCAGGPHAGKPVERMNDVDKYFMTTDFNQYIGSTLGKLEGSFPIKYSERVAGTNPPTQLVGVTYKFPDNYTISVYFSEVKYTTYNNKTNKWDFRKITKETVAGINVKHYGTGDEYYCNDFGDVQL